MIKKALITGVTGQDGSYLAEFLLEKGYSVHGLRRRSSVINTGRIDHLLDHSRFHLAYGDLTDSMSLSRILYENDFDEIYNLGAQSHVHVSFDSPEYTANSDALGTLRLLDILKTKSAGTRFYQASTSELYGLIQEPVQSETTPFYPRSPYGVAKLYAYWITKNYREAYDMFAVNGILFNHESPRRGDTFVTRKVTLGLASILAGRQAEIKMGNLDAKRDWGHAKDYVKAQWLIMQLDEPDDFVVATGEMHTVRDFINHAFATVGISLVWEGDKEEEVALIDHIDQKLLKNLSRFGSNNIYPGQVVVSIDPYFYRPTEVEELIGDPSKIRNATGWIPEVTYTKLVEEMVIEDLKNG